MNKMLFLTGLLIISSSGLLTGMQSSESKKTKGTILLVLNVLKNAVLAKSMYETAKSKGELTEQDNQEILSAFSKKAEEESKKTKGTILWLLNDLKDAVLAKSMYETAKSKGELTEQDNQEILSAFSKRVKENILLVLNVLKNIEQARSMYITARSEGELTEQDNQEILSAFSKRAQKS